MEGSEHLPAGRQVSYLSELIPAASLMRSKTAGINLQTSCPFGRVENIFFSKEWDCNLCSLTAFVT